MHGLLQRLTARPLKLCHTLLAGAAAATTPSQHTPSPSTPPTQFSLVQCPPTQPYDPPTASQPMPGLANPVIPGAPPEGHPPPHRPSLATPPQQIQVRGTPPQTKPKTPSPDARPPPRLSADVPEPVEAATINADTAVIQEARRAKSDPFRTTSFDVYTSAASQGEAWPS